LLGGARLPPRGHCALRPSLPATFDQWYVPLFDAPSFGCRVEYLDWRNGCSVHRIEVPPVALRRGSLDSAVTQRGLGKMHRGPLDALCAARIKNQVSVRARSSVTVDRGLHG
jgi:hypothetical protein